MAEKKLYEADIKVIYPPSELFEPDAIADSIMSLLGPALASKVEVQVYEVINTPSRHLRSSRDR